MSVTECRRLSFGTTSGMTLSGLQKAVYLQVKTSRGRIRIGFWVQTCKRISGFTKKSFWPARAWHFDLWRISVGYYPDAEVNP
jgi:hypothetical protein